MNVLKLNSQGPDVQTLTGYLQKLGYLKLVQSAFDHGVEDAVKEFQAAHTDSHDRPLVVDGMVGPLTWWALQTDDISHVLKPTPNPPVSLVALATFGELVVSVAEGEMYAGAKEIGGNNLGPWVTKYLHGLSSPGVSWCAAYASWCFYTASIKAGKPMPYRYTLGAKDTYYQFQKNGWTYTPSATNIPLAGDIIVFYRGDPHGDLGHIGLVHHCANGILVTIEGNRGAYPANVRLFTYTLGNISNLFGFGRAIV